MAEIHSKLPSGIVCFQTFLKKIKSNVKTNNKYCFLMIALFVFVIIGLNNLFDKFLNNMILYQCYEHGISYTDHLSHSSKEYIAFNYHEKLNQIIENVKRINNLNFVAFTNADNRLILHSDRIIIEKFFFFIPLTNDDPIYVSNGVSIKKGIKDAQQPYLVFIKDIVYENKKIGHVYLSLFDYSHNEKIDLMKHQWRYRKQVLILCSFAFFFFWHQFQTARLTAKRHENKSTKINEGGICDIFLTRFLLNNGIEKTVVLKKLKVQYNNNSFFYSKLLNEARLLQKLHHPNIVNIYGFDRQNNAIIVEYIDGINLENYLAKSDTPILFSLAYKILLEICKGLKYIHQKKIVHLDLTLNNIILSSDGQIKIIDFGIAKTVDELKQGPLASYEGTLNYMSPEQLCGEILDESSDVYSFGIIAYRMVTGKKLYSFKNKHDAIEQINNPSLLCNKAIPKKLEHIIDKCLIRDKSFRYKNAIELFDELYQFKALDFF